MAIEAVVAPVTVATEAATQAAAATAPVATEAAGGAAEAAAGALAPVVEGAGGALAPEVASAVDAAAGFLNTDPLAGIDAVAKTPTEGVGLAPEAAKIFENPDLDPAIQDTLNLIDSGTVNLSPDDPAFKAAYDSNAEAAWDKFVTDYPEKAAAYAGINSRIADALERQRAANGGSADPDTGRSVDGLKPDNAQEPATEPEPDSVTTDRADRGEPPVDQAVQDARTRELEQKEADGTLTPAEKEELDRIKESKTKAEAPKTDAEKLAEAEQRITNLESRLEEMSKSLENMEAVVKAFSELLPDMQELIKLQIKNEQDPEKKKKQEALLIRIIKAIAAGVLAGFIDMSSEVRPRQG